MRGETDVEGGTEKAKKLKEGTIVILPYNCTHKPSRFIENPYNCNQLHATRDRVGSYRMKLGDSPSDSPASPLQLSVNAAS